MDASSGDYSAHITSQTTLIPALHSWEMYLNDQGKSYYTVKAFLGDLNLLVSYLAPDQTIGSISTNDLNNFLNWLQDGRGVPCSPKSLARRITSLKAFFRWLNTAGVIAVDPAEKVLQKTVLSPLPIVLTDEEIKKVLEVTNSKRSKAKPDARDHTLLLFMLETGVKKGECLNIHINHIDIEDPESPFVFIRYANPQYRYKERKIPVSREWIASYEEYLLQYKPEEYVFPWSPRRLEYLLEDIGQEAGLTKHLSFDMCRWTSSIMDWKKGVDHEQIRQKLGISKIQWREISLKIKQLAE